MKEFGRRQQKIECNRQTEEKDCGGGGVRKFQSFDD